MKLALIAAMGTNRVIGINNKLPWHMPADLQYFKRTTLGKPVIMGRKTYESIGKPLPGRENIIVTTNPHFTATGCTIVHSIKEAIERSKEHDEVMIIGGSQLFNESLPYADRLYLTFIHNEFAGDCFFPEWNANEWREISRENLPADDKNPYAYSFVTLERTEKR